jgi:uncharacterized circularly permuted ATP-grasp superfamily protein/uncharacterized alpha-E superfamily protein
MAHAAYHDGSTSLLDGYTPQLGVYDECMAADGSVRPAWRDAIAVWDAVSADQHAARHRIAERYLSDNGVAHRVYGSDHSEERPWPLSHVPLVIDAQEWSALEAGLIQRAELLEQVVADLYGPQRLVEQGHIPAMLVAGAPGFLRPLVGTQPKGGHHLHYIAIELGRGPDGRWWVLGDRTQAPSGGGYALENRLATSRAMGTDLPQLNVRRLAAFFQGFREALGQMRGASSARVGLLTPGPFNQTYYEQAFLARYLGFLLLEGGDLIIRNDALYVRTVRGLKPLDVLWRRVDADFCDPLELRADSRLGVPGLVQAARSGGLTCVNALGAGVLESRAFMAFLPQLSNVLLGEPLALPNIATWWRGDPAMREQAEGAGGDTLALSAYGTSLPLDGALSGPVPNEAALDADLVTQESVRLSTMPTFSGDTDGPLLQPRPVSLRAFLARTSAGWQVMPGGFARVSESRDTRALTMQDGTQSCDVWVRASAPQAPTTLLPGAKGQAIRRVPGTLPARAADNLFWLGRYTERAQLSLRLLKAYLNRSPDVGNASDPLLSAMEVQLALWSVDEPYTQDVFARTLLPALQASHACASAIRDRFSPDGWQTLNQFVARTNMPAFQALGPSEQIDEALYMLAAFAGLVGENMIRLSGWRFLEIGRRIERALGTSQLAGEFGYPDSATSPAGRFDLLLEVADSVMSYRQRYSVTLDRDTVLDLVVLDPNNPRSVTFQLEKIQTHIDEITDHAAFEQKSELQRLSFSMWSTLHTLSVDQLQEGYLAMVADNLGTLSAMIGDTFITPGEATSTVQL